MLEKRYSIVRVEHYCPIIEDKSGVLKETPYCPQDKDKNFLCSDCKMLKNYGDTKEQLVRKIAQVLFKAKLERYRQVWKCECSEMEKRDRYKCSLILAKEIVEFLGVE